MWPALQKSMSSLETSAHQLRNQSAKPQRLPEEQPRAYSHNTKFKQRLQQLFAQQNVSASNCSYSQSELLPQMPGKRRNGISPGVCEVSQLNSTRFFPALYPSLLWNILRAPDLGTEELSVHRVPSPVWWEHLAFVFLISECEKNPSVFSGHSCWMKVFDTYPWLKKERFFMNADGLLVQIWMKRKISSYVMQRSAFPLWNWFCGELREEEGSKRNPQEFSWVKSILSEMKKTFFIA